MIVGEIGKMKTKKTELNVDFIGGQGPLNEDEERALGEFFRNLKEDSKRVPLKQSIKRAKQPHVTSNVR